ncbi:MAG: helix-turn-helix transcriptional regulator [Proteobacteria bacterium]|nr:helix-turn-helix transcriptional regulator [Pseudomonadota bacterium]
MNRTFGEILEMLLEKNHLSVRKFSTEIKVSPKTVGEWIGKNGRFPNSPSIIKRIADYFNISVHELLYDEIDPTSIIDSFLNKTEIYSGYYKLTIEKVDIPNRG